MQRKLHHIATHLIYFILLFRNRATRHFWSEQKAKGVGAKVETPGGVYYDFSKSGSATTEFNRV